METGSAATGRPDSIVVAARTTCSGRTLVYRLSIIQQPERARACGSGSKAQTDRRPVDPPPMTELRIYEGLDDGGDPMSNKTLKDITFEYSANFFLFATLEHARSTPRGRDRDKAMAPPTLPPVLSGMPVSGMAYLDRPHEAGYFLFPDLSVRHEGRYRLAFNLYEQTKNEPDYDTAYPEASSLSAVTTGTDVMRPIGAFEHRMEIKSGVFNVYSAKKFPGLQESTNLSKVVADQGCRVRIRREVRMRQRGSKSKRGGPSGEAEPSEVISKELQRDTITDSPNPHRARSMSVASNPSVAMAPQNPYAGVTDRYQQPSEHDVSTPSRYLQFVNNSENIRGNHIPPTFTHTSYAPSTSASQSSHTASASAPEQYHVQPQQSVVTPASPWTASAQPMPYSNDDYGGYTDRHPSCSYPGASHSMSSPPDDPASQIRRLSTASPMTTLSVQSHAPYMDRTDIDVKPQVFAYSTPSPSPHSTPYSAYPTQYADMPNGPLPPMNISSDNHLPSPVISKPFIPSLHVLLNAQPTPRHDAMRELPRLAPAPPALNNRSHSQPTVYHAPPMLIEAREPEEDVCRAGSKRKHDSSFVTDTKPLYHGQRQQDAHHAEPSTEISDQPESSSDNASESRFYNAPGARWRRPAPTHVTFKHTEFFQNRNNGQLDPAHVNMILY